MNLAQSLSRRLRARSGARGVPGYLATASCFLVSGRLAGGLHTEPGARVAVVLDNRLDTALLYWAAQSAGAIFRSPVVAALGRGARLLHRRPRGAAGGSGTATCCPRGPSTRVALDRDDREVLAPPLHLRHDRPPEGRPPLPRRRPGRRPRSQALHHGYPPRRSHPRGDAALPHDGHPLAPRHAPRRGMLRPTAALGSGDLAPDPRACGSHRCTSLRPCSTTSSMPRAARRARPLGAAGTRVRRAPR